MHFMTVNIQFSYLLCVLLFSFFTQKLPSLQLFVETFLKVNNLFWALNGFCCHRLVTRMCLVSISFQNRTWWQCAKYAPGSNQFDKFGGDRQTEQTEQTDNWQTIVFLLVGSWDVEIRRKTESEHFYETKFSGC